MQLISISILIYIFEFKIIFILRNYNIYQYTFLVKDMMLSVFPNFHHQLDSCLETENKNNLSDLSTNGWNLKT